VSDEQVRQEIATNLIGSIQAGCLEGTIARVRDVCPQEGTGQGIILDDEHGGLGSRPDKRAAAVLTRDQSLLLQVSQHTTHGQRRDPKLGRQLALVRERGTGSELAAEHAVAQHRVDPARPWAQSLHLAGG
jgi:hypothetical protein